MKRETELQFYEGQYVLQIYCLVIYVVLLAVATVYAVIDRCEMYIPFVLLAAYILTALLIFASAKIFLKRITIGEKGITVLQRGRSAFYAREALRSAETECEKFSEVIFTPELFCWLVGTCYLNITTEDQNTITILCTKKNCRRIKELLKNYSAAG